ncbi:30S ribosomal protein S3 [Acholeplasma oculi]|uniref:Small ribosomal subunit protein uS3 n=1 Tax=Acholeplasma oculi TaxID=35623 RepID=A0A061AII4_9MOLU|nr:30S ribosomal protein S3 [Acholeplasma oculi]CDR31436.1 30S ribosomal protein S3 [Acholeplasma oculi]SKC39999.1 SSU ribosomal protein S3P [Acholeplasma oculi]SUT92041.1 30S ribosomal protein S3 [Acholeplasma oculi]
MGQKTNPNGLRLGIIRTWESKWYADKKDVPALIKEDALIREFLNKNFKKAGVSQIEIERVKAKNKERITIKLYVSKPGIALGKEAADKNKAVSTLEYLTKKEVVLNIVEVKRPEKVAILVAQSIAEQLENRASFRRAQKMAIQRALKSGAKGIRTLVSGRLGGAEIARSEGYSEGRVPLHTLRADVDYATAEALTTYGILGIKVWIYHGEVLPGQSILDTRKPFEADNTRRGNNKRPGNRPERQQRPQRNANKED